MQWIKKCTLALLGVFAYNLALADVEPTTQIPGTSYYYTPRSDGASYYHNPSGTQSFYCYQGARYIRIGMTTGDVLDACGSPKSQHKQKAAQYGKVPVKQWVYNIAPTATTTGFLNFSVGNSVTMMVYFKNDKLTNITVGGQSAQSTSSLCDGPIAIGDSPNQVIASCGQPSVHNETYENVETGIINEIEIWTYQPRSSDKMVTLTFVNGLLDKIVQ